LRAKVEKKAGKKAEKLGEILALRKMILRLGQRHLGSPDESQIERLNQIVTVTQIEAMIDRIDSGVASWDELLAD